MRRAIRIGCVADDFTGAGDAASFLAEAGMETILMNGIPDGGCKCDSADAIVIALKSRTQEVTSAVDDSLLAIRLLKQLGARQIYIKYCSTFDSTPKGNIGPVCDAALEELNEQFTLLCPSLPANGRTVKEGRLFVHGIPLHETHMRHHPLTPMWSNDIAEIMAEQSKHAVHVLTREQLKACRNDGDSALLTVNTSNDKYYLVPDYQTNEDGRHIAEVFGNHPLLTGGSGLLGELGRFYAQSHTATHQPMLPASGNALILCGSCSEASQQQVRHFLDSGGEGIMLDPMRFTASTQTVQRVWHDISASDRPVTLVYSSGSVGLPLSAENRMEHASALEDVFARLAVLAVSAGYTRIIVAGGETSGAVSQALQLNAFRIGPSIAPGVPILIPEERQELRLVLKSGNFGQVDFFDRAVSAMGGQFDE